MSWSSRCFSIKASTSSKAFRTMFHTLNKSSTCLCCLSLFLNNVLLCVAKKFVLSKRIYLTTYTNTAWSSQPTLLTCENILAHHYNYSTNKEQCYEQRKVHNGSVIPYKMFTARYSSSWKQPTHYVSSPSCKIEQTSTSWSNQRTHNLWLVLRPRLTAEGRRLSGKLNRWSVSRLDPAASEEPAERRLLGAMFRASPRPPPS